MRDQLLAKVQARISSALAAQEYSEFLGKTARREERDLRAWLKRTPHDDGVRRGLGWWHWLRHLAEDSARSRHRETALAYFGPAFVRGVGPFPEPLLPELAYRAFGEAVELLGRVTMMPVSGDEVIAVADLWQRIVDATPRDDPNRGARNGNLSVVLNRLYELTGDPADLDRLVAAARKTLEAFPRGDEERLPVASNLALALLQRASHHGSVRDLTEAVSLLKDELSGPAPNDMGRTRCLAVLGQASASLFEFSGDRADLNDGIDWQREALDALSTNDPLYTAYATHLSRTYLLRARWGGGRSDLDEAVRLARLGLTGFPEATPDRARALSELVSVLTIRFEANGDSGALDEALRHNDELASLVPEGSPHWWVYLLDAVTLHRLRFTVTADPADLNRAVALGRRARDAVGEDFHELPAVLHALLLGLKTRVEHTGDSADLTEAVLIGHLMQPMTEHYPDAGFVMAEISSMLALRYHRFHRVQDLDEAITWLEEGLARLPTAHHDFPAKTVDLSRLLRDRYRRDRVPEDLDRAVEKSREAFALAASESGLVTLPMFVSGLADALRDRFEATGDRADLDEAISLSRESVNTEYATVAERAHAFMTLAFHLEARAALPGTAPRDAEESIELYERVWETDTASTSLRVSAAARGARAAQTADPARALRLFEGAVGLLPRTAPHQTLQEDQQVSLVGSAGIAADAAALTLDDTRRDEEERAWRALELLEAGRAVTLGHGLTMRADLSELWKRHPESALRFGWLRDTLNTSEQGTSKAVAPDRHELAAEFDELIAHVRTLPGFSRFCLPPNREDLLSQAAEGPVVVVNSSARRCDALVLTTDRLIHVPLTSLLWEELADRASRFDHGLSVIRHPRTEPEQRAVAQKDIAEILGWVWDHVTGPVLDALGCDRQVTSPEQADWPRVWWVPVGLMGMLPLHASGHHGDAADDPHRRTVLDRVVSSYTPTVRALGHTRARAAGATSGDTASTLIVGMPTTPGLAERADLHHVPEEVAKINGHLPGATVLCAPDSDGSDVPGSLGTPTGGAVMDLLSGVQIAHFACHGTSHPTNPALSQLHLADRVEHPLTSQRLAGARLDQARLAYLSACRTSAVENIRLLDEVVHLSSALQLAGFRHVVGTLWEIDDRLAVTLADRFYAGLRVEGTTELDTDRSAWALHQAVRYVRDARDRRVRLGQREPFFWAGLVHTGA